VIFKEKMANPKQKAFCVLQFAKHESVVSLQRASGDNFRVIPHLPTALGVGIITFRQRGALTYLLMELSAS
jgi:hypothetical protein